mmetsp:Transcript_8884/g.14397  ORF Transcript_8884/g.14397 Transcript_8884/m.14397 type:complete len:142 (-) Transcript_8884:147-572(-)
MTSRPSQPSGAVALWHCCACGREWRAENLGDDTECCPFAPKMLAFGAKAAWGQHNAHPDLSDDESDVPVVEQLTKVRSSATAKLSTESTAPGSRSSSSQQPGSPGSELRSKLESLASHGLEDNLSERAMHNLLSRALATSP